MQNFDLYIPHPQVASYYRSLLHLYPLKPYLDKKEDLVKWVWYIHNKVNDKLEKKRVSLEEFYETYHAKYKNPKEAFKLKYIKYTILALAFLVCLYYIYLYYGRNRWRYIWLCHPATTQLQKITTHQQKHGVKTTTR